MRAGQNPAKFLEERVFEPARVTVAIITHIPYLHGYYAESLEVLRASLRSLKDHTELPYDLMIFDNASGEETREFLLDLYQGGQIDYLFLSKENLGKGRAWESIFSAAPGDIVAYADSDVYFNQGWLNESVQILETFPKVGMVTSRPMRTYAAGHTATQNWAQNDPEAVVSIGNFLDWETFREHDVSLGHDVEEVRERYTSTEDVLIEYRGARAYAGAAHWQFIAYAEVLREFLPLAIDRPLGDDRKLDDALNNAGYLRIMTVEPLVRHMGNTLPEGVREEAGAQDVFGSRIKPPAWRLLDWPPVRRVLLGIYNRIFRWYFYR